MSEKSVLGLNVPSEEKERFKGVARQKRTSISRVFRDIMGMWSNGSIGYCSLQNISELPSVACVYFVIGGTSAYSVSKTDNLYKSVFGRSEIIEKLAQKEPTFIFWVILEEGAKYA